MFERVLMSIATAAAASSEDADAIWHPSGIRCHRHQRPSQILRYTPPLSRLRSHAKEMLRSADEDQMPTGC